MATTPEGRVKAQIKKLLVESGAYYVMPVSNGMGNHGVPDFLICMDGMFIAVEAKAGTNKPTALQQMHLDKIQAKGGVALVINETNYYLLKEALSWTWKT
jgi:Holliday junction resolvase